MPNVRINAKAYASQLQALPVGSVDSATAAILDTVLRKCILLGKVIHSYDSTYPTGVLTNSTITYNGVNNRYFRSPIACTHVMTVKYTSTQTGQVKQLVLYYDL